jgi:predicted AAA+ superfamily ATPase
MQVCWELTERNSKREIAGLVEACKVLALKSGAILTYDQEDQLEEFDIRISLLPTWKWLILDNIPELSSVRNTQ